VCICCGTGSAQFYMPWLNSYIVDIIWCWWNSNISAVCLFIWLEIVHVNVVIDSLFTNIYSSLIQIGSRPCLVCIARRVAGDCHTHTHTPLTLTSSLVSSEWSASRPGRFTPWKFLRYQFNTKLAGLEPLRPGEEKSLASSLELNIVSLIVRPLALSSYRVSLLPSTGST
jgi:hypothetical protein